MVMLGIILKWYGIFVYKMDRYNMQMCRFLAKRNQDSLTLLYTDESYL